MVGLALLLVYSGRTGWLGGVARGAGLQVIYAPPGMIMATAFVSLPLVIREIVPVLHEIGTDQEQAARSLGASPVQTFLRITLPAIRWALLYGVVLSLARSLGEFGAVKIVSGGVALRTQTATLLVEERYQQFGSDNTITAYTAAFILALIAVIALVVVTSLRPKETHVNRGTHEHQDQRRQQVLRRLRRAARHRPGHRQRRADRPARARAAAASRPCCGSSRASSSATPAPWRSRGSTPPACRRRSATSGFVFQHYAAFRHLSVAGNVGFGLKIRKRPKKVDRRPGRRAARAGPPVPVRRPAALPALRRSAAADGAGPGAGHRAHRAAADEPFGALDAKVRKELRDWLRRLHDEVHVTTVFVTHDQEEALEVADRIVVINAGGIEQVGTPTSSTTPRPPSS